MLQLVQEFVVTESTQWFYTYTLLFISYWFHTCIAFPWLLVQITEQRVVMMSASLCTQTGLHNLTIQVLNIRVWFLDIWYTSLTSVHYNLEHRLAIVTESFSLFNLYHATSVQIRSDTPNQAIPDTIYLPCALNWFELIKS